MPGDITAPASAASAHLGVLRSANGGQSWVPVTAGLGGRGVYMLAVDPAAVNTIYADLGDGAYESAAAGGGDAMALAVNPARPGRTMAISVRQQQGYVYCSEDEGEPGGGAGGQAGRANRYSRAGSCRARRISPMATCAISRRLRLDRAGSNGRICASQTPCHHLPMESEV